MCLFPSICSSGQAPPLWRRWLCSHIWLLPAQSPEPWAHLPLRPFHPRPTGTIAAAWPTHSPPGFPASEYGLTATPAPELELGVILDTSLSPPHAIGHQLCGCHLQKDSSAHSSSCPHRQHQKAGPNLETSWFQQLLLREASLPPHSAFLLPPPCHGQKDLSETWVCPLLLKVLPWLPNSLR